MRTMNKLRDVNPSETRALFEVLPDLPSTRARKVTPPQHLYLRQLKNWLATGELPIGRNDGIKLFVGKCKPVVIEGK